jgi:hypothetical protein
MRNNTTLEVQYYMQEKRKMSPTHVIARILSAPTLSMLISDLRMFDGCASAYNMNHLLPPRSEWDKARVTAWDGDEPVRWRKRTIEFRQHEGTLDNDRVAAWVMTVSGLLEFAQRIDDAALMEMLTQHMSQEERGNEGNYGVIQLFRDIGLEQSAAFYQRTIEHLGNGHIVAR